MTLHDMTTPFFQGIATDKPTGEGKGSWVHVGLVNPVQIDKKLLPGTRVTVQVKEGGMMMMTTIMKTMMIE